MNENYTQLYIDFLRKFVDVRKSLKVVFDASNGPAGILVKKIFANTPVDVFVINDDIDPDFKAHGPNPLSPSASSMIQKTILEEKASLGVMFDADADRAVFFDEEGVMMDACFSLSFMFGYLKTPVVVDELVYQAIRFLRLLPESDLVPSRIGAFFLKEKMRDQGIFGGGEFSGHYFFKDFFNADSGIFASIFFLNALSRSQTTLSHWKQEKGEHTICTEEIKIQNLDMASLLKTIENNYLSTAKEVSRRDGLSLIFDDFWCNIRASNTEPILRIIAGGRQGVCDKVKEIKKLINEQK